jgi:hypothetical protein
MSAQGKENILLAHGTINLATEESFSLLATVNFLLSRVLNPSESGIGSQSGNLPVQNVIYSKSCDKKGIRMNSMKSSVTKLLITLQSRVRV